MEKQEFINETMKEKKRILVHDKGKIYFTKATERKIFFALTIATFVWVILSKFGLF